MTTPKHIYYLEVQVDTHWSHVETSASFEHLYALMEDFAVGGTQSRIFAYEQTHCVVSRLVLPQVPT